MTTTAIFFSYILQGHEATQKTAIETAQCLDWGEVEREEQSFPYLNFIDSINGIEIYYNYGCDSYYFAQAEED